MTKRDEATERQVQAARPDQSTWLAANAGSGKTRVLTDRVARLLLAGTDPQKILCLTYTKAAASEMQNRLFRRLGSWSMLDDEALSRELQTLGVADVQTQTGLAKARTLFARAVETPGGLKIQTIHSFCAGLLRRFPLEAGVSPQFAEMEDRAGALLRAEILDEMAEGPDQPLVDAIASHITDEGLADLLAALTARRDMFSPPPGWADILDMLELPPIPEGQGDQAILDHVFTGDLAWIGPAIDILSGQTKSMADLASQLGRVNFQAPDLQGYQTLCQAFLLREGGQPKPDPKIKSVPTKKAAEALGPLLEPFHALMHRVAEARNIELGLDAAAKTRALSTFAEVFLRSYAEAKQARGWLDFDDLILGARHLLSDPAVAAWVLYRLDGGIDHILVDEAQDTSPEQWDVIEKLAQEFTSGEGARTGLERTIFVVGDKKQSIYSFQGADPDAFDRMQADFGQRLTDVGTDLASLTLEYSFRSAAPILNLVDRVFGDQTGAGFDPDARHIAFKSTLPGRVDLWPIVPKAPAEDDPPWHDPVDRKSPQHDSVILAERIAGAIRDCLNRGETLPVDGSNPGEFSRRPVTPGDFLILVRRRSALFSEIIRACKAADLPIAGADRLKVGAELAVKDLAAFLSFLATPEDDLSLAAALRSPLFGLSEQDLFRIAHDRDGAFLWTSLRHRREIYPDALAMIDDMMQVADYLRPYDLIERILTRHEGRRRLLARLGPEAEDGINALLSQALGYERANVPNLTGFLHWMETDDLEIKRQMGTSQDQIRVMTVHGSKGLEAPIVILPDTGQWQSRVGGPVIDMGGKPAWRVTSANMPRAMKRTSDAARDRQEEERLRLMYVALTRAEKWLIVAGSGDLGKSGTTWYDRVRDAMEPAGATPCAFPTGEGLRIESDTWSTLPQIGTFSTPTTRESLPELFRHPAPAADPRPATLSPSDLGGAKALPSEDGLDEDAAKARGTAIHRLLEVLPGTAPAGWTDLAANTLTDLSPPDVLDLLDEVSTVLTSPNLAEIFAPDALAEVSVSADFGAQRLHGTIDRLLISETTVTAVDFKTNAGVPDHPHQVPQGILRQMAAYSVALAQVYPDRTIETAILWTRTARLMRLPHDIVTTVIATLHHLDETRPPT